MKIPRIRTIIGLISAPAIIAGGLATFTLASADPAVAGQPVTQTGSGANSVMGLADDGVREAPL